VAVNLVGSQGDDSITGAAGDDRIEGGGGSDSLDGGTATEVRYFNVLGTLLDDTFDATFDFMGQGNLTLTEGVGFVAGAGNDAVGVALATLLNTNLAQATADFQAVSGGSEVIDSVVYDANTDQLTFTFDSGVDVTTPIDLGYSANGDTSPLPLTVTAEITLSDGGDGGVDTFVYGLASDSTMSVMDSIVGFVTGGGGDVLDLTAPASLGEGNVYVKTSDMANFAAVLAEAQAQIALDAEIFVGSDGTDTWVFVDTPENTVYDADVDMVIQLVGITTAGFSADNILGESSFTTYA
jgi:hypothetical protein